MNKGVPTKLQIPLTDVHFFVEQMPDGIRQSEVGKHVPSFSRLSLKDKEKVMNSLEAAGHLLFLEARHPNAKRACKFLRHKKYGYPKSIPGYIYPLTKENQQQSEDIMISKSMSTHEDLRKKAEELLRAADEAEKKSDFIKKLQPLKLELSQAVGALQRKTDEFIDAIDVLNKAMQKLRDL